VKHGVEIMKRIIFTVVFIICMALGCGFHAKKSKPPAPAAETRQPAVPGGSYYLFLEKQIQANLGNLQGAVDFLEQAVSKDPASLYLKEDLALLYLQNKENEKALGLVGEILTQDPDSVDALILDATLRKALDKNADVKPQYERVLANSPELKNIYLVLGKMYMDEGDLDNALRVFERMTRQFEKDYTGYFYVGLLHGAKKDIDQAEAAFIKTLELAPELIEPRMELIKIYQSNKQPLKVIHVYEEILERHPGNIPAAIELGLLYHNNFRTGAAASLFKELGKKSVNDPNVVRAVLRNLILQNRNADAVVVLEGMLNGAPENSELHYAAGIAYYTLEKMDKALARFASVRPEADFYPDAALHMAIIHYKDEKIDEGIAVLEGAYAAASDKVKVQIIPYLSSFYVDKGWFDEAAAIIGKGLEIAPSDVGLIFEMGVVYDKQGRADDAVEQMKTVIQIDPDHADALNYVGYTYADKGINLDEAKQMIKKALELKPDNGYIIDSLGWVYYKKGLIEEAASCLEMAADIVPEDPTILEHLGDVYLKMDDREKALEVYERSLMKKEKDKTGIEQKIESLKGKALDFDE